MTEPVFNSGGPPCLQNIQNIQSTHDIHNIQITELSELQDEHPQYQQMYQRVDNAYTDPGFAMPLAQYHQMAVMQIMPGQCGQHMGDLQTTQHMLQMAMQMSMPVSPLDSRIDIAIEDVQPEDEEQYSPESSSPFGEIDSGEEYTDHEDQAYFSPESVGLLGSTDGVFPCPMSSPNYEDQADVGAEFMGNISVAAAESKKSKGTKAWTNKAVLAGQHVALMTKNATRMAKARTGKKGKYFCSHCPQRSRTILELAGHMDLVMMTRPFHCPEEDCPWHVCGFPTASEWCRHTRSQHGKVIMMNCDECGKRFTRKDSLKRHALLVHDNSNSRYNRKMRNKGSKRVNGRNSIPV